MVGGPRFVTLPNTHIYRALKRKCGSMQYLQITGEVYRVADGCNELALGLYRNLSTSDQKNLIFSPSSISIALAMTLAGADGATADEIRNALQIDLPDDQIHESIGKLVRASSDAKSRLQFANRLWCQSGYRVLPEFRDLMAQVHDTGIGEANFSEKPDLARQNINEWVSAMTNGCINNLLSPGAVSDESRLVLVNAVYFLAEWHSKFEKSSTKIAPFHISDSSTLEVEMMQQCQSFRYGEFDDVTVLEIPYRGPNEIFVHGEDDPFFLENPNLGDDEIVPGWPRNFVMTLLLPRMIDGLTALESSLTIELLNQWTQVREHEVDVKLPKFQIESTLGLKKSLASLGVTAAFDSHRSDFQRITDDPDGLVIDEAIHKAFVRVDEEGTEAAAATAVGLRMGGFPIEKEEPKVFHADHPFLFMIRERLSGLIHFVGRVASPETT